MGQSKSKVKKESTNVPVISVISVNREHKQISAYESDIEKEMITKVVNASTQSTLSTNLQSSAKMPSSDIKMLPSWLNENLFVHVLKENIDGFKRVSNFEAFPALSAGENYVTQMLRINIDVELNDETHKNTSYMLKFPLDNAEKRQYFSLINYFSTENEIYSTVIPEIEQMYNAVGVDVTFAPKAYKFPDSAPHKYILMQDLQPLGFQNANRIKCLDMKHAKCVLQKLAQYHAATATRVASKGSYVDDLMNGLYAGKPEVLPLLKGMMETFRATFLNNLNNCKDNKVYEPYLKNFLDNVIPNLEFMSTYDEKDFNVLNHGDCWANNILFKYDEAGAIVETQFVDFQLPKYGSPAQDLYYFIFSSLQIDIKLKEFDYLIRFYYDHLIENLKLLNYPKKLPLLREIYIQLFKYGIWSLCTVINVLPIVLLNPTKDANIENYISNNESGIAFKNLLYSNESYQQHMNEILPWLHNRGLLEGITSDLELHSTKDACLGGSETSNGTPAPEPSLKEQIPHWVNESLFIKVLSEYLPDFNSLKSFSRKLGTNSGDNYASLLLEIDTEVELKNNVTKNIPFIMKVQLCNEAANAVFGNLNLFEKEICVYNEFIPKFESIFKKFDIDMSFAPKYYHLNEKVENGAAVILENLRPQGYKNCNRLEGLDESHTKAVLRKLAEFHAASAVYALENDFPAILQKGMYVEEQRDVFETMGQTIFPIFYDCVKKFEGHEEYYDKMIAVGETLFDNILKAYNQKENFLNVLNHGDIWTNNILFKHNESGEIENTYLIDYQMVQYGSPAIDLYYFLISSPALDIKLEKFELFVKYYYDHLVENLVLLKYTKHIPALEELNKDMMDKGILGYASTASILSSVLLDPTDLANIENMFSEESAGVELKKQLYLNPRYRKHAEAIFPWLNRRGFLDAK